ncbi:pyridoxal phosphate-dependent aminotransferase family protein [Nocardiopsis gilva]
MLETVLTTVERWQAQDVYPLLPVLSTTSPTRARLADGREVTVFGTCDYLGLSQHPDVVNGALEATQRYGTNTYGTQIHSGHTEVHRDLETSLAAYLDRPAALLFPTGLTTNMGVIGTLMGPRDAIFTDRFNHGSIALGARLSGARVVTFAHNDTEDLATKLAACSDAERRLIVVDGLFSTSGDYAPLCEIADLAERHQALLMVDEAHSMGTVGTGGRGAAELAGVLERVDIIMCTMSKAFGSVGGFVAGSVRLVRALRHSATAYLLSFGVPPGTAGASLAALTILSGRQGTARRERLAHNAAMLREALCAAGVDIGVTTSHIVPVIIGPTDRTARVASWLLDHGLLTAPMLPPAVPFGSGLLRLGATAEHEDNDIATAARLIPAALRAVPE